ncbi:MAG TPA: DUF58 domain-containing protein [Opitutales bacterium]|nr:DUF58 domain-containing protein [Opitutales bacterium]
MTTSAADLLSPATLARIDNYSLLAKTAVEGYLSGIHRSLSHGTGGEFFQYRNYTPGDDLKYVDWKVFSRQNKFHTKVFREETNMNVSLVLDASGSLDYNGSRAPWGKWRYAAMIAASLAYLANRQGDNVGLYIYNDQIVEAIEPSRTQGQLQRIFAALARQKPSGSADHRRAWNYLTNHFRRRGLIIFLSDFLDAEKTLPPLLKRLRFAHHDCLAFQVLDPDELDLPFDRSTEFIDRETGRRIDSFPAAVRDDYQREMNDFLERLSQAMSEAQVDFLRLISSESLADALANYLHKRESLR